MLAEGGIEAKSTSLSLLIPLCPSSQGSDGSPQSWQNSVPRQLCYKYLLTHPIADSSLNHNRGVLVLGRAVGRGG